MSDSSRIKELRDVRELLEAEHQAAFDAGKASWPGDIGATHPTDQDWNEAFDSGRELAELESTAGSAAQEAFRATIEAGYYPEMRARSSCYMCIALDIAFADGVITEAQHEAGTYAIERVLDGQSNCMAEVMLGGLTRRSEDCEWAAKHGVDLYMNWDERVQTLEFPEWEED